MRVKLAQVATERGISQAELARRTGLHRSNIRRFWFNAVDGIEATKRPLTRVNMPQLQLVADALGVTVSDLLEVE